VRNPPFQREVKNDTSEDQRPGYEARTQEVHGMAERAEPTGEPCDSDGRTAALGAVLNPGVKEQESQAAGLPASAGVCSIEFGGQHEITLGKPIDFVRPDLDGGSAPCQVNVGVVSFGLGDFAQRVGESKSRREVRKLEFASQMVPGNDFPVSIQET